MKYRCKTCQSFSFFHFRVSIDYAVSAFSMLSADLLFIHDSRQHTVASTVITNFQTFLLGLTEHTFVLRRLLNFEFVEFCFDYSERIFIALFYQAYLIRNGIEGPIHARVSYLPRLLETIK